MEQVYSLVKDIITYKSYLLLLVLLAESNQWEKACLPYTPLLTNRQTNANRAFQHVLNHAPLHPPSIWLILASSSRLPFSLVS